MIKPINTGVGQEIKFPINMARNIFLGAFLHKTKIKAINDSNIHVRAKTINNRNDTIEYGRFGHWCWMRSNTYCIYILEKSQRHYCDDE